MEKKKCRFIFTVDGIDPARISTVRSLPERKVEITFLQPDGVDLCPAQSPGTFSLKWLDEFGVAVEQKTFRFWTFQKLLSIDLDYSSASPCCERVIFDDVEEVVS